MPCFLRRPFGLVMAMSVALVLLDFPVRAEGQLDIVAKFEDANLGLDVVTYTSPDATRSASRVALLGFRSTSVRTSFVLSLNELVSLLDLWRTALNARSDSWKVVGSLTEVGTTDVSVLTVSAGPGVKFAVTSLKGVSITYVLANADVARFEKALFRVKDFLSQR
jgi:hypothetical protein